MPDNARKKYLSLIPQMLAASLLTGVFIYFFFQPSPANFFLGLLIGFQAHLYISTFEMYIKPKLSKRNFFLALLTSTLAYVVLIVVAVFIAIIILNEFKVALVISNYRTIILSPAMGYGLIFGLVLSLLFSSYAMFEMLLGRHFLIKLFTGKYHNPFEEARVFMFLDLKSSTSMAEKLGHKVFLQLLNDFFYDVSVAVAATKGEIYKYVGDEAIVTWKINKVAGKSLPLDCFFRIESEIQKNRASYEKRYNLVPAFKAGLHGGIVVTGEMGHMKKEIAFLGDVLNTTARIEELCKILGKKLLVSDYLLEQLSVKKYHIEPIGEQTIRGKSKTVSVSSVHSIE
jgi:adenylate cyclase